MGHFYKRSTNCLPGVFRGKSHANKNIQLMLIVNNCWRVKRSFASVSWSLVAPSMKCPGQGKARLEAVLEKIS